ncbi:MULTISPECIES: MarR family winged helix-turn-helix transcriptional regulator [unclassified Curtobacterium]|uniref:MarR family winged helix-turn-helix transcriptional regulator n=1 Tax=unclassified Curtobacterium TaxID=257496 RepID=UPI000DA9D8C8|nr:MULTISPECIES: MarR family winged helix-turn-helix transcriptional regulator [unclassified Curtobacterium]PZE25671.1 MarR family transcriptional regulator [Curtobacterium sp. MCBD17_028]PZE78460.1 MarR family transcriptional regulator [Curtobacterium sp. MCBD17_019]PZF57154.1 MarR family transcriptional regulator [Curtobacterium sp. MCBD17_034]PZM33496.1 MarR family transcriptional regulator [Curtobacterium sp. MCBD17_031]
MSEVTPQPTGREQIIASFLGFSAAQNELMRLFARQNQMHSTDAAAVVQIIEHEDRGRPLTPARLAERIGLSPGATSILLSRLETAGFVERTREVADRRVVTLRSTKAINDAADAYFQPLARQLDDAFGAFTPDEIDVLSRAAARLQSVLETYVRAAAAESETEPS